MKCIDDQITERQQILNKPYVYYIAVIMYLATLGSYPTGPNLSPVASISDWIQQNDFLAYLLVK